MSEYMPHFAPVVALLFLGTVLLVGTSVMVLFYGAVRPSAFFRKLGAGAAFTIGAGYVLLLTGVSLASNEENLPAGGWKYFCEIDCHLAYSLIAAETLTAIGPELQHGPARGEFVIVRVKTWFDERTISAHRGNGPLTPNARKVVLVDDAGRSFTPSAAAQPVLARFPGTSTPLTQPLRPGESYLTDFAFDVPEKARRWRLLITDDAPETRLVIGHENSLMHKKIYWDLDSAPSLTPTAQ